MTDASEQQDAVEPKQQVRLTGWHKFVLLAVMAPFAGVLLPSLTVLFLGMLPTLAAAVAERGRDRHLAVTVGLINFCGCVPLLVELWLLGQSFHVIGVVARDVYGWLIAYSASGLGWVIYLMMPPFVAAYYKVVTEAHLRILKRDQRKLIEVWGEELAETAKPAQQPGAGS